MKLQPYKFQVVAVCQKVDDEGRVLGEMPVSGPQGQPVEVFGVEELAEWARAFPDEIAKLPVN
jgi:hypothetical protein